VAHSSRPAAYIRVNSVADPTVQAARQVLVADLARRDGWSDPVIYVDQNRPGQLADLGSALAELTAAVNAGRHSAVLLVGPGAIQGCPAHLLHRLLSNCCKQGVRVDYLPATGP
jgi:hypothetical protein